jgi:hypothetical protein
MKPHFKVTIYATNDEPEKEIFFKNAKECQEFLKIKSYSILYNIIKGHTKYAQNKNKHLKDTFKVERCGKNTQYKNDMTLHKLQYQAVLHNILNDVDI